MRVATLATRFGTAAYLSLAAVLATLAGVGAATSQAPAVILAALGIGVVVALLQRFGSGCAIGLLTLAALDALPGPNLETARVNSITAQDIAVLALIALLAYENGRAGFRPLLDAAWGRAIACWAALFLSWYAIAVTRTWLTTAVPLVHAITFSRQFAYFAVLVALFFGPLRRRALRDTVLATLGVGALATALAQSLAVASHTSLSLFVHISRIAQTEGLTRLYTSATVIPFAALPLGFGVVLFARSSRQRAFGGVLAAASLIAILLGLTRAMYLGEIGGLTAATVIVLINTDARAQHGRRQFAKAGLLVLAVTIALFAYTPPSITSSAINGVSQRLTSLVSDLGTQTAVDNSLQVRQTETRDIESALGSHWLVGLGFLDPTYVYVSGVPAGDINQVDVSLLGAVAMIGIIGIVLYALPLLGLLAGLLYGCWTSRLRPEFDWLAFGGIAWCVGAIIVSPTLGLFFIPAQVAASALILALIAASLSPPLRVDSRAHAPRTAQLGVSVQQAPSPSRATAPLQPSRAL